MPLRVAELETLFTANVDGIARGESYVKQVGQRIESKPIVQKVDADNKGALASMARVEDAAKRIVSKDQVIRLDADIARGEKSVQRVEERIESLKIKALGGLDVRADVGRAEAQLSKLQRNLDGLKAARGMITVQADPGAALAAIQQVDGATQRLVSKDTAIRVNANIREAQNAVTSIEGDIAYLRSLEATFDVDADIRSAENKLAGAKAALRDLEGARSEMVVDVNDNPARQKLEKVEDFAGEAGAEAGEQFGGEIIAALAAIPIAGAVIGIGAAAAKALLNAFNDGLQQEVGRDRLEALTGISEVSALRLGRMAGEAYANTFGESVEQNMDTARLALQFDIIDEESASRDAQSVIEGLAGISDVLGEEVRPIAAAVATMIQTGIAKNSQEAFDIFAAGARNGVNRAEDLLDTFTEYPALFARLGLSGEEALGLVNQGLQAGARNSDLAADALKEFQIRATDGSEASADAFKLLGIDAESMTAKIANGGKDARDGLDTVLDKLRQMKDPVERNAAAVGLFGTQAEDLGDALFAMDLSTAVDQLGQVEGAARTMFDTLTDNDASKVERAKRNIEVAVDGIQGALATAFSEPLGDFADWVSQNRGPLLQFFADMVNGAIDFAIAANEGFGSFVSGPLADMVEGIKHVIKIMNPFADTSDLESFINGMRDFESQTDSVTDRLEEMRSGFNGFADGQIALGYLNDASLRLADAIGQVGDESGDMESQVRNALQALKDEGDAAAAAGEDHATLEKRYRDGEAALIDQMKQMGLTRGEAKKLIDTVKKGAKGKLEFDANTALAQSKIDSFINSNTGKRIIVTVDAQGGTTYQVAGTNIRYRAGGGPVYGPGGPTDDQIPAMLSNNEHVLTADDVVKAGGHGQIYALRAAIQSGDLQRALRGRLPGFASGGAVTGMLRDWRTAQRRGENRYAGMNGGGLDLVDELLKVVAVSAEKNQKRLRDDARRSERQYLSLEKAAERADTKLQKARDRMAEFRDTVASIASGIASQLRRAFDVSSWSAPADQTKTVLSTSNIDGVDVTTSKTTKQTGALSSKKIASDAKKKGAAIKRFAQKLEELAKKKYEPGLIAEIASLGVEEGEPVADALLNATKGEIEDINSGYRTANRWANKGGKQVAEIQVDPETKETYKKLIEKAQKQIDDAKENANRIRDKLASETDRIIRTINSALGKAAKRAGGGQITGPGGPRDEQVLLWGSNGEHMLTADEVQGLGGHARVAEIRRAAREGRLGSIPAYATGGPVTTTGSVSALAGASTTARPTRIVKVKVVQKYPVAADPAQKAWEAAQIVAGAALGGSDV